MWQLCLKHRVVVPCFNHLKKLTPLCEGSRRSIKFVAPCFYRHEKLTPFYEGLKLKINTFFNGLVLNTKVFYVILVMLNT